MKKKIFLVFIFFQFIPLYAKEKNWGFSILPAVNITLGTLGEYLFSQYDTDLIVSDLQWNECPLWSVSIDGEYNYKNFFITAGFSYFIPASCGAMYDSDYNSDFKTNYWIFKNSSDFAFELSADLKYKFNVHGIKIIPALKTIYSVKNFKGFDGYGYSGDSANTSNGVDVPWNSSMARKAYKVSGINYSRETLYTFAGCQVDFKIKRFAISLGFFVSPFTMTNCLDYHTDETGDTPGYKSYSAQYSYFTRFLATLCMSYDFTERFSLVVDVTGLWGTIDKGYLVTNYGRTGESYGIFAEQNQYYLSKQKSGSCIKEFSLKTGCRILF